MSTYLFPGQGSQRKGMGNGLFEKFSDLTAKANDILGYDIQDLCLNDPDNQLKQTQYTQPALFVVNALTYLQKVEETGVRPDFVAGHSLGEYNALFAAGAFDFETGLRLVQKRGELMSQAKNGGMAAVIRLDEEKIEEVLKANGLDSIDIANYNSPSQIVISGPLQDILDAQPHFEAAGCRMYTPLKVSAAFHSRYMQEARDAFHAFLKEYKFSPLNIKVVANVTARPYPDDEAESKSMLANQITSSVKWTESIRYLMGKGEDSFEEVGPGKVLASLYKQISTQAEPLVVDDEPPAPPPVVDMKQSSPKKKSKPAAKAKLTPTPVSKTINVTEISPLTLGNSAFRDDYGIKYAYVAGSMSRGTGSKDMVIRMGQADLLGFLWTGGRPLNDVARDLDAIAAALDNGQAYGANLVCNLSMPRLEDETVDLLLQKGVDILEAVSYLQITPSLVRYRLQGIHKDGDEVVVPNRIIAKLSRPEVAKAFMSPPPTRILERLVSAGQLTEKEADLAGKVPMSDDICVQADSGGATDQGVAYALMPAMLQLRDDLMNEYGYRKKIRVGAAGGIGAPHSAAAAFVLGADFIMTGSINQCTVEASTSDVVKDMLSEINVQDTDYAPAEDMFEMGARVQVLKRGLFFPARANKLYALYQQYASLEQIDSKSRKQLEDKYFKKTFEEVWSETKSHYEKVKPDEIEKAEKNAKHKMLLVFKWYLDHATRLALDGVSDRKVDFQVYCGPAMGAFNQWVKGSDLSDWRKRHVDDLAEQLITATSDMLNARFQQLMTAN